MDMLHLLLGAFGGSLVGCMLGVCGGGGSILAVPLMIYLVGVPSAHVAIGTSAVAVAANAAIGLVGHARRGAVNWRCGGVFALCGVAGALVGSQIGKAVDGRHLMLLFSILMVCVATLMLRKRHQGATAPVQLSLARMPNLMGVGAGTGVVSGFFGIGGGFLIVPGLMQSVQMPALTAVATSLVAVTAFGLTTAASYAWSGYVLWPLAGAFIVGGAAGITLGTGIASRLAARNQLMSVLATLIICVGVYVFMKSLQQA